MRSERYIANEAEVGIIITTLKGTWDFGYGG